MPVTKYAKIKIKRGQGITETYPALLEGERALDTETNFIWVGTPSGNINLSKGLLREVSYNEEEQELTVEVI